MSTFKTALRQVDSFDVFKLEVINADGKVGIGEVVATPAITKISPEKLEIDIKNKILPLLSNLNSLSLKDSYSQISERCQDNPTAQALADLSICSFFEEPDVLNVKSDVTVPIVEISEIPEIISQRIAAGFTSFKIKLSKVSLEENLSKVSLISRLVPIGSSLRIDPNQSWDVDYSIQFLNSLERLGISLEYLEQPVSKNDVIGLKKIKENTSIELMADESCFNLQDLERILELNAVDWVNVKILKSGGFTPARELAQAVKDAGLKLSVGTMMESPIGVKWAIALAAQLEPQIVHDLDAAWWYPQKVFTYQKGVIT